jgi:hypothetical protein
MTVTTSINKVQALGNDATTAFPYSFRIYSAADLVVTSTDIATGVDIPLVLNTDYTVTGAGSYNGGNVVIPVAPITGTRITILRVEPITQATDLRNQGAYFAETHEDVFDKLTMIAQQQQEELARSLKIPASTAGGTDLTMPTPSPYQLISWNAAGDGLVNADPTYSTALATDLADDDGVLLVGNATDKRDLAASSGAGLMGWIRIASGAVATTLAKWMGWQVPTVLDFVPDAERAAILAGTSTYDCTSAFTAAFLAHNTVRAPAGLYNVTTFSMGANKQLLTDGMATIFQQIAGTAVGTHSIEITGSNVILGDCWVKGNIATDTNEQNHAVFVQANAVTGSLNNIHIGNIKGTDIRGDVVYAGQATGALYALTNVTIGDVIVDNVYRNGVSIVSGAGVTVRSVTGSSVGFCHLDVESNAGSGPCVDIKIGYIKGRNFGVIGTTAADYCDAVEVGVLDLSPTNASQSVPPYAPGAAIEDGMLLRNTKRLKIGHFKAVGFNRCASFTTYNGGELGAECVEVGSMYLRTCSLTDATYNSYINGITLASNKYIVGHVDAVITGANKRVFAGLRGGSVRHAVIDAQASSAFMRDCQDVQVGSVVQAGANGFLLSSCNRIGIKGGSFTGDRLASSSDKCTFENFTATAATFLFSSGQEDHIIQNCTLNGDYVSFGNGIRSYLHTLRFGAYQLWIDANGRTRRKGGVPASDTDGAILNVTTKGATGSRPTFTAADIGGMYFDTTLAANGKPIFWTGTAWVDGLGAAV